MKDMTRIINKEKTIKTEKMSEDWRIFLTKKWNLAVTMNEV